MAAANLRRHDLCNVTSTRRGARPLAVRLTGTFLVGCLAAEALLASAATRATAQPLAIEFSPPANVSSAEGLSDAPAIVTDIDGRIFVAWEERPLELALISRSEDAGHTFGVPVAIVPGSPYVSFGQIEMASLGVGEVHTVFTAFDLLFGGAEIVYASSSDGGETFPDAALLSPIDNFNSYTPDIATGWGIAVAWSDMDVWTGHTAIMVSVSTDDGMTFSQPTRADASFGYACCQSVALGGEATVFLAWQEKIDPFGFDDAYEILFSRSSDGGATFSAPVNVSNRPRPSLPPRIATDANGTLYVLWVEGDYLVDLELLLAVSHDGGETFDDPVRLDGPTEDVRGDLAVSSDGALWVAWITRGDAGVTHYGRVTRSLDAGESFAVPADLPGDCWVDARCEYTIAAASSSRVFIAEGPAPSQTSGGDVLVRRGDVTVCGDANDDGDVTATDSLVALSAAVGIGDCALSRCDADGSGMITASDALVILSAAVGIPVELSCPQE
jgi:hypothetical protein